MGGSINFVFREESGKVHFREIWTGGMNFLQSHPLLCKKESPIPLCDEWYGDKEIYDAEEGICLGGYGLFVIDYMTNEMYSVQGYCGLGSIYTCLDPDKSFKNDMIPLIHEHIKEKRLVSISKYELSCKASYNTISYDREKNTAKDLEKVLKENYSNLLTFTFDLSPITVRRFEESEDGYEQIHDHMETSGFIIDERNWKRFVKDQCHDDE